MPAFICPIAHLPGVGQLGKIDGRILIGKITDWEDLKDSKKLQRQFNAGGSDMYGMLRAYMEGKNQSWAIRFCYNQFEQKLFSVHPFESLVDNKGFGEGATNCKQEYSRFFAEVDETDCEQILRSGDNYFKFSDDIVPDKRILSQLRAYHSIKARIYSKLRNILNV